MKSKIIFIILTFLIVSLEVFAAQKNEKLQKAIFAGGCFWCMQPPFDKLKNKGVVSTTVGYSGGDKESATYEKVSQGGTGHLEAIEVAYNPDKISYRELLKVFWLNIDLYNTHGQFCDKGEQYVSAVFYSNKEQKKEIENSIKELKINKQNLATKVLEQKNFYPAEEYHQEYYLKNSIKYKFYRTQCGRDKRLKELWN